MLLISGINLTAFLPGNLEGMTAGELRNKLMERDVVKLQGINVTVAKIDSDNFPLVIPMAPDEKITKEDIIVVNYTGMLFFKNDIPAKLVEEGARLSGPKFII